MQKGQVALIFFPSYVHKQIFGKVAPRNRLIYLFLPSPQTSKRLMEKYPRRRERGDRLGKGGKPDSSLPIFRTPLFFPPPARGSAPGWIGGGGGGGGNVASLPISRTPFSRRAGERARWWSKKRRLFPHKKIQEKAGRFHGNKGRDDAAAPATHGGTCDGKAEPPPVVRPSSGCALDIEAASAARRGS